MAFFKFRFPGQADDEAVFAQAVADRPSEHIDAVRRRARHRLMGSVVLVLLAVVGFPFLFDTQPRPVAVDTPIVIPDRQTAEPLVTASHDKLPAKPLQPGVKTLPTQSGLDAREEALRSAQLPSGKPQSAQAQTMLPTFSTKDDGSKAQSLLDAKKISATAERHVIQVGAFADTTKLREVRKKLEQAGLTTYIQTIEDKDGKSTTRVRVGPFASRDEADQVAVRIRKLGFAPSVLRI